MDTIQEEPLRETTPTWRPDLTPEKMDEHPLVRNRARIPTPPIRRVYEVVSLATVQRTPGCCFVAHPRFGKTFAIRVLTAQLQLCFSNLPIVIINAKGHTRYSEGSLYSEFLEACGHSCNTYRNADTLRRRLVRYLWNMAEASNSDRIVLFVDEAQNWQHSELSCLRDISNDLELLADIALVSVFFGQPQLASVRSALLEINRIDLIGRFLTKLYEFPGLASLTDLEETMTCYDDPDVSEYPDRSGMSYSQFFLPIAFNSGWRLAREAGRLWDEFNRASEPYGGPGKIGMQWVARSIRIFLVDHLSDDNANFCGSPDLWRAAVAESRFTDCLGVTYDPTKKSELVIPMQ